MLSCCKWHGLRGAIDLFMAFDDDHNGYIDYDEFLRQIFPEEYVKERIWSSNAWFLSRNLLRTTWN